MATANANTAPGATRPVDQHVEFVVKPAEDLILEGSERSVIRVRAGTPYSCLMLKNQRFSSLFRHYAKHHGLRKDDLAYYFTEELQNEDTPETVFLLVRDEIVVRRRKTKTDSVSDDETEVDAETLCPDVRFIEQMGSLLDDDEHCDVTFFVGLSRTEVKAHKTHLIARSEYFRSMFKKGSMRESQTSEVVVHEHDEATLRQMLEYIYTNRVKDMPGLSADEVIKLLALANEFLLEELKALCEHSARRIVSVANVAKMLLAAERYQADTLKTASLAFVQKNMPEVCRYPAFEAEISANPKLSMFILQGLADARQEASGGGIKKDHIFASDKASQAKHVDQSRRSKRWDGGTQRETLNVCCTRSSSSLMVGGVGSKCVYASLIWGREGLARELSDLREHARWLNTLWPCKIKLRGEEERGWVVVASLHEMRAAVGEFDKRCVCAYTERAVIAMKRDGAFRGVGGLSMS